MPFTTQALTKLQQAIDAHPEFFYDLFVDPNFSNNESDTSDFSYLYWHFSNNPEWAKGPLSLFRNNDTSRLTGPNTTAQKIIPQESELSLADLAIPLRADREVALFYKLRNHFEKLYHKNTNQRKPITASAQEAWNSQLIALLKNIEYHDQLLPQHAQFLDGILGPVLNDVISNHSKEIQSYLHYKDLYEKNHKDRTSGMPIKLPDSFQMPENVTSMQEWVQMVNDIYTGNPSEELVNLGKSENQLISETFAVISKALELDLGPKPNKESFVANSIYKIVIAAISKEMLTQEKAKIQMHITEMFTPSTDAQDRLVIAIVDEMMNNIKSSNHISAFDIDKFQVQIANKNGKKTYFVTDNSGKKLEVTELKLEQILMRLAAKRLTEESPIYKNISSIIDHLEIVASIAMFGDYKQPLLDAMYAPITSADTNQTSLLNIYNIMNHNTIPVPEGFQNFTTVQKALYNLLGNVVRVNEEQIIARRFAIYALYDPNDPAQENRSIDPSIKLIRTFKGPEGETKRVQYLVLEMIRTQTSPAEIMENSLHPELKLAAHFYNEIMQLSKSLVTPTKRQLNIIENRIIKGELSNNDLKYLMKHTSLQNPLSKRPHGTSIDIDRHPLKTPTPNNRRRST